MFHLSAGCLCTCTSTCSHAFSTGPFVIIISCFLLSLLLLLLLYCSSLSSELIFVTFVGRRLFHPPTLPVFTLPPNFSPLSSPNFRPLSSPHASPPLYCLFFIFTRPVLCHRRLISTGSSDRWTKPAGGGCSRSAAMPSSIFMVTL